VNPKYKGFSLPIAVITVALISAAAGAVLWNVLSARQPQAFEALMVLPEPRVIADFSLTDHDGEPFTLDSLRGRWSLIFFGFTHCPDVCPSTLYDLQQVHGTLTRDTSADHQVLFVSVDPERDTPEVLKQYVNYFDPDFIGVSGENEQLAPLTLQLGIAYRIEEHEPGDPAYRVDHSASILLTDPQGRLHGVFPAPHDAGMLSADMTSLLR
jgi:protein SCO1/2